MQVAELVVSLPGSAASWPEAAEEEVRGGGGIDSGQAAV